MAALGNALFLTDGLYQFSSKGGVVPETAFIADVHLSPHDPKLLIHCLEFLNGRAKQLETLFILGDLFEIWLGDDDDEPSYKPIVAALRNLTNDGVAVKIMRGNRDFLLGEQFAQETGCELLSDMQLIDLYGVPTLIMHGDTLCTLDTEYQTFRRQVRDSKWQHAFLSQPLVQRRLIAQQARARSQSYTKSLDETVTDVTTEAVESTLRTMGVCHLIHGHTHRPAVHHFMLDGQHAWRRVLGAWGENAIILTCTPTECKLVSIY